MLLSFCSLLLAPQLSRWPCSACTTAAVCRDRAECCHRCTRRRGRSSDRPGSGSGDGSDGSDGSSSGKCDRSRCRAVNASHLLSACGWRALQGPRAPPLMTGKRTGSRWKETGSMPMGTGKRTVLGRLWTVPRRVRTKTQGALLTIMTRCCASGALLLLLLCLWSDAACRE